jgi:hypothetical protein
MTNTFHTDKSGLLDRTGKKVLLRGVNKMSVWELDDPAGEIYFAEIRKTQANSVRIVWAIAKDDAGSPSDPILLDTIITNARKNYLIPMIELHDGTGQWDKLPELVDYWVRPEIVSLIERHEGYLLVNIGNEVGDDRVTEAEFFEGYRAAVKKMRAAGIKTPLVIDAPDWGKNIEILNGAAPRLIEDDADHNLLFSVHAYWTKSEGATAASIKARLGTASDAGYPLVIGEFSKYGGNAGRGESKCGPKGEILYKTILRVCDELNLGWYAWEWGPGNGRKDPLCAVMDMTPDLRFAHLKAGWATDVVNSIQKAAANPAYFTLAPLPAVPQTQTRTKILQAILTTNDERVAVESALEAAKGDWTKAGPALKTRLSAASLAKVSLANSLADWSGDNAALVKAIASDPSVTSMRDVALKFDSQKLAALVDPAKLHVDLPGSTRQEKAKNFAATLQHKLFAAEPTAVLHRMIQAAEIPIADTTVRAGVARVLDNLPDFNIRTTSVYTAFQQPDAFKNVAPEQRSAVVDHLKTIQRVQAISPVPEAVRILIEANLTSAFRVAQIPETTFLKSYGPTLGADTAKEVYTASINSHIRNEHTVMALRDVTRGAGLAVIDGLQPMEMRAAKLQAVADRNNVPLTLETLFGSIDQCECDDCLSVYSPAAYFVELLQYLRNNNLDPDPKFTNTGKAGIVGTPLEMLFRRRPDLGCLELTCENTFTVLPYVDLANEVMESFVVHLDKYATDGNNPKQATLEVFNVTDETTSELLAQPQHVNYQAYCILKNAVYSFTLPYHQPIDVIRIWLKYLGTTRWELLDAFRTPTETCDAVTLTPAQLDQLKKLHGMVFDRSTDAEFLGIVQEEYIILTREAFWSKAYFELTTQTTFTDDQYRQKIGVKPVHEYYGYGAEADMLETDESKALGLTFVKRQFLKRTGIQYTDLVALLQTRFINPAYPQGEALSLMDAVRFSYRFLQTSVDSSSTDPKVRFAKLIAFLNTEQALVPSIEAVLHPDPCHEQQTPDPCGAQDFSNWVYCYFERIGKLIVLDSGEGPQLPIEGLLFEETAPPTLIGKLRKDGTVTDTTGRLIGSVDFSGKLVWTDGTPFDKKFGDEILIEDSSGNQLGAIHSNGIQGPRESPINWLPARDTCDLDPVRLLHLDGTPLTVEEYDRMQRFIRLWHKLGWTIDQADQSLVGLTNDAGGPSGGTATGDCHSAGFDTFGDDCSTPTSDVPSRDCGCRSGPDGSNCPDIPPAPQDITVAFLHQIVAVKKLLDLTGLPLEKLLTFWTNIGTAGEKPLYSRLFLTHNLLGIDTVFQSDKNGNFLLRAEKISDHMPVLMAALKATADDIAATMTLRKLSDSLTLANVSTLYRHSLMAKLLHVPISSLVEVFALFDDPFKSADAAISLLTDWGTIEDAGFTFPQLDYIVRGYNDPKRPIAPSPKKILLLTKTIYDGLIAIDKANPDLPADTKDAASDDLVRAKAGLIFESSTVEMVLGVLDGTTNYTTNAPAGLTIAIPDALAPKVKYLSPVGATPPAATLQLTGILSDVEITSAKALSPSPEWPKVIDRAAKQALHLFNDVLFGIFPNTSEAVKNLLAADANVVADPSNPSAADANTGPQKRLYFLTSFLPFLRKKLGHKLIVDTLSGGANLTSEVTDALLSDILTAGPAKEAAITVLEKIHQQPAGPTTGFNGDLIPPTAAFYTFIAISNSQPDPILLNGTPVPFPHQQDDPSNVWSTDPVKLKASTIYTFKTSVSPLEWKTSISPKAPIPASALLPDYTTTGATEAFLKLYKAALVVNALTLGVDELEYLQAHQADFDMVDFNGLAVEPWRRLCAYAKLRAALPQTDTTLVDLFQWANDPDVMAQLSAKISAATLWSTSDIDQLIAPEHFDLNRPEAFRNEINLLVLQKALTLSKNISFGINRLFEWANPASKFSVCHRIAGQVQAALRARFDQGDWEEAVKPLYDQLRQNQQQALVAYLLVQPTLIDWGVVDADSLFEFFLIDVQMCACMDTSRIKQAISSVQSFIQRCFLGLEAQYNVPSDALDWDRWAWMQKYRVWEANRKVFLYPENWIKSELRDDKSPFFKELESELLQKDVNSQTIDDALRNYVSKVDEVANLKVAGLFLDKTAGKLHVFARTRNAAFFYYYRYFDTNEGNWYPWDKVQVDIPNYDVEDENGHITLHGTYLIPVVWNGRLLVFFPQFTKKTAPSDTTSGDTVKGMGDHTESESKPVEYWEIKIGWSEYRNKKWAQKQISVDAVYTRDPATKVTFTGHIGEYQFIPRVMTTPDARVVIEVYFNTSEKIGRFDFTGSQIFASTTAPRFFSSAGTKFHVFNDKTIHSLQAQDADPKPPLMTTAPFFTLEDTQVSGNISGSPILFSHHFAHELVGELAAGSVADLFDYYKNKVVDKNEAFGQYGAGSFHELKRAHSLYNWEAAFHAPMFLVDRLVAAQQFDQALATCHYVLNAFEPGTDPKRFWEFYPFTQTNADNDLEALFLNLKPNAPDAPNGQINEWRNHPFQPHVVARSRPSAYMRWVAMKYIQIWISYGDYYFRQNTLETIPLAIQCYVVASHLYGPKGQKIPKRGHTLPQTYLSLLDKWDAFGNAMVELELAFPFSNQTSLPIGISNGVVGLANVFGFATTLYFCIPDNPQLRALRDTIDDRLFKIRHCEDIDGVFRQLPLFEPPIDPGLLVQAAAQGLSLSSVLNDLNSPMPNYRFYYLLQKAMELCSELKALGSACLAAKEKGDAEALSQLRARHESSIQNLVMDVKKQQLEESGKALEALEQSRKGPGYRLAHFLKLIGEDLAKIPDEASDFGEIPDQIETPIDDSGLKLISFEKEEMDKASAAADWQVGIGIVETLASVLHAIPLVSADVKPLGVGVGVGWGGSNLGNATQAIARGLQTYAGHLTYQSTSAGRKGGLLRQLQDRVQQANVAGYELKSIDKQILTQQIRINIAQQEITNQQKQIDNAQEVEDFLRNKFTNQELYSWMDGEVRTLHYQAYTLAYDLAKRAEKVFRFERGLATSSFIQYGYWDATHDGLLSGERMYQGLKQMETAYQERRGHDFEISKSISLRQLDPLALLQLRETGSCEFAIPELLFDMDYPGQYMRRIKSLGLRIPCVLGPHTSLNCTLRLLEHKFRTSAISSGKGDYPQKTDGSEDRFTTVNVPITSIAVSSLEDESGVFELNFHDERYLPFEGAGVVSKWRIELPDKFRQFDYDGITDVIIRLRYTSIEGGEKLKQVATGAVLDFLKSVEDLSRDQGLFTAFDLKNDFSDAWYTANHPVPTATERVMTIDKLTDKLPIFTKGRKIRATDIYLFSSGTLPASAFTVTQDGTAILFADGPPLGAGASMKCFVAKDIDVAMNSLQLTIADTKTAVEKMWLLHRYTIA